MDLNELELYELLVDAEEDGVFAVSAVSSPAIERGFIYMNKQEINLQSVSDEKRLVAGPLLIPNKKILRVSEDGLPYSIFFSPETIETIARKFMKNKFNGEVTIEHGNKRVDGVYLTENWLIDETKKDKSNQYGFMLPKGTWFGIYKVENDKVWEQIKNGELKGFSVEALLEHKVSKVNPKQLFSSDIWDLSIDELTDDQAEILLNEIAILLKKNNVELESYTDYPQSATNNAKRALEYVKKNGWGDCGEATGKQRANQLANREPISRDTIARMASFKRHQQNKDVPYTEGCGGLMWDCWGGTSGIEWAISKLKQIDLAVIGPRGGIVKSPKAPAGDTPNRNPKGEGTAKGDASGKSAKVSADDEKTLEGKVKDFNEKESNTKNGRATLGQLKSVFQRGLGAFNTSHSPVIKSASAWAFARVNAYLYLLKNGRPENPKYTTDYDLLPKGHPKASDKLMMVECDECGHSYNIEDGGNDPYICHKCGADIRIQLEVNPSIPNSSYPGEVSKKKKKDELN